MTEEIRGKGLTWKSIVVGCIFVALISGFFQHGYMGYGWTSAWGTYGGMRAVYPQNMYWAQIIYPFAMLFLLYIVVSILNKRLTKPVLNRQELAVITVMIFITASICMWGGYTEWTYAIMNNVWSTWYQAPEDRAVVYEHFSPILIPRDVSVYEFLGESYEVGGTERVAIGRIPWGAWTPLMSFLMLVVGGMWFAGMFIGLLYRHVIIDVEEVGFPTTAGLQKYLVEQASTGPTIPYFTNKYFLFGFLANMLAGGMLISVIIPSALTWFYGAAIPGGQHYLGNWFDINWTYTWEGTRLALLPASALAIPIPAGTIGWAYLLPLDLLISFWVVWLIWNFIIPTVVVSAGLAPAWGEGAGWTGIIHNYPLEHVIVDQFPLVFGVGLCIGLALYPLWRHRSVMGPILTSLWKKPPEELEQASPMPYRYIWIGLIISGLMWVGACIGVGAPPAIILFVVIGMMVFPGLLRLMAETGGGWGYTMPYQADWYAWPAIISNLIIWGFGIYAIKSQAATMTMLTFMSGAMMSTFMFSWAIMYAWKLQKDEKIIKGDMLKAVLITLVLALVAHITMIWVWGALFPVRGDAPRFHPGWWGHIWSLNIKTIEAGTYWPWPEIYTTAGLNAVIGTVIASIVLIFLSYEGRRRIGFLRWFNPIAILFAVWFGWYIWFGALIAVVAKFLLMRIGGVAAVEKGRYFAIGMFAAFAVSIFFKTYMGGRFWYYLFGFAKGYPAWPTIY